MPSPIAHAAMGWTLHRLLGRDLYASAPSTRVGAAQVGLMLAIGLSWLPDLDFIPGLITGEPKAWHNQGSHSLVAALIAALVLAPLLRGLFGGDLRRWILLVGACYGLHVLMDACGAGRGVRLLWPFSMERFAPPTPLFVGVRWIEGFMNPAILWTLINELAFATALWALLTLRALYTLRALWPFKARD